MLSLMFKTKAKTPSIDNTVSIYFEQFISDFASFSFYYICARILLRFREIVNIEIKIEFVIGTIIK